MPQTKTLDQLRDEQIKVLQRLDDEWVYFDQIYPVLPRRRLAAVLRGLSRSGWVVTRRNDVPGQGARTEYALSPEADRLIHGASA